MWGVDRNIEDRRLLLLSKRNGGCHSRSIWDSKDYLLNICDFRDKKDFLRSVTDNVVKKVWSPVG